MEQTQELTAQEQFAKIKADKQARYEQHCETYAEQLRLLGYIKSLEADNESIEAMLKEKPGFRNKRRAGKLIKINDKDIKKYKKMLSYMPEVPEFK